MGSRLRQVLSARQFSSADVHQWARIVSPSAKYDSARTLMARASKVFDCPEHIAASTSISTIPKPTHLPEIIVTGRANVGKSTLLNAVLGRKKFLGTSKKAGHTRALNFYRVGHEASNLIMVDTPGYGARGRPKWGALFDHYVQSRQRLKQIYILFNAEHGLNDCDNKMLEHLSRLMLDEKGEQRFTLQAVITKADTVPVEEVQMYLEKIKQDIWGAAPLCLLPIVTSAEMCPPFGIETLRLNIIRACDLC